MKLVVVIPPFIYVEPQLSRYWLGTIHLDPIAGIFKPYKSLILHTRTGQCLLSLPRGLEEYTCSADFPNLSVACPSSPCPLI